VASLAWNFERVKLRPIQSGIDRLLVKSARTCARKGVSLQIRHNTPVCSKVIGWELRWPLEDNPGAPQCGKYFGFQPLRAATARGARSSC